MPVNRDGDNDVNSARKQRNWKKFKEGNKEERQEEGKDREEEEEN